MTYAHAASTLERVETGIFSQLIYCKYMNKLTEDEITCTGPACAQYLRIRSDRDLCSAVPLSVCRVGWSSGLPEDGWFCDEDCHENAGFRRRGGKKIGKSSCNRISVFVPDYRMFFGCNLRVC